MHAEMLHGFPGTIHKVDASQPSDQVAAAVLHLITRHFASTMKPQYTLTEVPTSCTDDTALAPASETGIPFSALGYITYKRTYARRIDDHRTEEFPETIDRVLQACQNQLQCGFTAAEMDAARRYFLGLQASVAGRMLWQLGTANIERTGSASLYNCGFVPLDSLGSFLLLFDLLMNGCGLGVSVQPHHIACLPPILDVAVQIKRYDYPDADYIVSDSRQGWVNLLDQVLNAFFVHGGSFTFSTHEIRPAGTPLKTFGGIASGPECLCEGIANICDLLQKRQGQSLSSVDCLDLCCIIGQIVVSGNIRRSALLALGSCTDIPFLSAKRWDLGTVPNWRANVNCSVVCEDTTDLPPEFWQGYQGMGEPYGLINLRLMQLVGRIGDRRYPDNGIEGVNPCAEMGMHRFEGCVLSDIYLSRVPTYDDAVSIVRLLYRICKHTLRLPCHHPKTTHAMLSNMRMGIGVTGYLEASEEQRGWLPRLYEELRAYDKSYSAARGWPESVRLTTCKPSGTLSLLGNTTHGCSPAFAPFYIRRIRMATSDPLCQSCVEHGYHCEPLLHFDGSTSATTSVVSFPCKSRPGTPLSQDMSAVQQLEAVTRINRDWCDNNVSNTILFTPEELPAIQHYLQRHFKQHIKCCSFLPRCTGIFTQMPYEEISEAQYLTLSAQCKPFKTLYDSNPDDEGHLHDIECGGASCPPR
jgi:adenosylcobalamin-dependent ribonucleoside-triphosphate reductase